MRYPDSCATQTKLWLGFLCILVLIPVLVVEFPPMPDYPNHLARLWLISGGADISPLNRIYTVDWHGIATNIGIDLAAKFFGHIIPPFLLGRFLLALAVILPPLGAILLHRSMFGKWHFWQILFLFFWCTETLLLGFLNFQISIGLALLFAAADICIKNFPVWLLLLCRSIFGIILILVHPFGLMFYGVLLAGLSFGKAAVQSADVYPRLKRAILTGLIVGLPIFGVIIYTGAFPGLNNGAGFSVKYTNFYNSIIGLESPFISYNLIIDTILGILFIRLALHLLTSGKNDRHTGMLVAALTVAVIACAMPVRLGQASCMNIRLPLMAVFMAMLSVCPQDGNRQESHTFYPVIAAGLVLLRTAWILWNWTAAEPMLNSVKEALSAIPAGARILPMRHISAPSLFPLDGRTIGSVETYRHMPALAVPWHHAFDPMLFTQYGLQPVHTTEAYAAASVHKGGGMLPTVQALGTDKYRPKNEPYIKYWRKNFDYVLVLNADIPEMVSLVPIPADLRLIRDCGFARLYKIPHFSGAAVREKSPGRR